MYVMYIREYIYYLVSLVFSSLFREDVHVGRMVEGVGSREARACDLTTRRRRSQRATRALTGTSDVIEHGDLSSREESR